MDYVPLSNHPLLKIRKGDVIETWCYLSGQREPHRYEDPGLLCLCERHQELRLSSGTPNTRGHHK